MRRHMPVLLFACVLLAASDAAPAASAVLTVVDALPSEAPALEPTPVPTPVPAPETRTDGSLLLQTDAHGADAPRGDELRAAMWSLLAQRDPAGVRRHLVQQDGALTALDELLRLELDLLERKRVDSDALRAVQEAHADHAEVQFRAGALWLKYVRHGNFFARRNLLKSYIAATLRAAELAPENGRYMVAAGIAVGQPAILGGVPGRQVQLLNNWRGTDPAYGLRARMDLAQNQQDRREGERLMAAALQHDPAHLLLRARVANLAWTYDMDAQAQTHFSAVCALQPADNDYEWDEWIAACENAASLAADGAGDRQQTRAVLTGAMTRAPQGLKPALTEALALLE